MPNVGKIPVNEPVNKSVKEPLFKVSFVAKSAPQSLRFSRKAKSSLSLDLAFWKQFAKNVWEKQAKAYQNISTPLLELDENEIFSLLVLFSERCRKSKNIDGMKLYVEGHRQFENETLVLLPKKTDRSLLGYHERMSEMFPDYCLVCDELLQVNHSKQDRLAEFTEELYKAVGFPNRFTEMGLYLGNYRKTPFGVHLDGCGVFSFPVVAKKTIRNWKPDYVASNPKLERSFKYAKHRSQSQVLTAQPGDMTYWPSKDWHVAESDGSFSATWSLGVWVDQNGSHDISTILTALVTEPLGKQTDSGMTAFDGLHSKSGEVTALPELYRRSIERMRRLSPDELESAFLKAWMSHTSKQGFKNRPPSTISITRQSVLQLRSLRSPVRWMKSKADKNIYYSFGSVTTEGSKSKDLLTLIKKMNSGGFVEIASSLKSTEKKEFDSLCKLASAGAFRVHIEIQKP